MKTFLIAAGLAALVSSVALAMGTEICFAKGEKLSGANKICYYNCPSGEAAVTVKSYELCPLNIKR